MSWTDCWGPFMVPQCHHALLVHAVTPKGILHLAVASLGSAPWNAKYRAQAEDLPLIFARGRGGLFLPPIAPLFHLSGRHGYSLSMGTPFLPPPFSMRQWCLTFFLRNFLIFSSPEMIRKAKLRAKQKKWKHTSLDLHLESSTREQRARNVTNGSSSNSPTAFLNKSRL